MAEITRRTFLKLAMAGSAMAAFPWVDLAGIVHAAPPGSGVPLGVQAPVTQWGRVLTWGAPVVDAAKPDGKVLKTYSGDDLVTLRSALEAPGLNSYNNLWYETDEGYMYSAFVQPVENAPQSADWSLWINPAGSFLGEISVPYVEARLAPDAPGVAYRLYYSTVCKVIQLTIGANGVAWYGLTEGLWDQPRFYVPAQSVRRLLQSDLAPLSPGADKSVKVTLGEQKIEAYEGTRVVFTTRTATGAVFNVGGKWLDDSTPVGQWRVFRKAVGDHMTGGTPGANDYYDLPGVPWCSYFTDTGVALHGAYWHNDYGIPRSHGCVNLMPADARWFFRWTEPAAPYDEAIFYQAQANNGTIVEVTQ